MRPTTVQALSTSLFRTSQNLIEFIQGSVVQALIEERMILVITSKIVSLAEGRIVTKVDRNKVELVKSEADVYLGEIGHGCLLTVKFGLLIPSAGIDESNSETGDYILFPENPNATAQSIWSTLRRLWGLEQLGIILSDSRTMPLRKGVTGMSLSHCGFRALKNMVGSKDLFGRELRMTQINFADPLAAMAVMTMGEGADSKPLAVIHGAPVEFTSLTAPDELKMNLAEDIYYPLLRSRHAEYQK